MTHDPPSGPEVTALRMSSAAFDAVIDMAPSLGRVFLETGMRSFLSPKREPSKPEISRSLTL